MSSEIKVDTISENTSANGVTIDGVLVKDNKVDVNGTADGIILDADADTTISADTDDQILKLVEMTHMYLMQMVMLI